MLPDGANRGHERLEVNADAAMRIRRAICIKLDVDDDDVGNRIRLHARRRVQVARLVHRRMRETSELTVRRSDRRHSGLIFATFQ